MHAGLAKDISIRHRNDKRQSKHQFPTKLKKETQKLPESNRMHEDIFVFSSLWPTERNFDHVLKTINLNAAQFGQPHCVFDYIVSQHVLKANQFLNLFHFKTNSPKKEKKTERTM